MRMSVLAWLMAGMFAVPVVSLAGELGIGDPAPKLSVSKWVKGSSVDLASAKGKDIVVVEFWATWCGPCVASVPHLTEMQQRFSGKNVKIIGLTSADPRNSLKQVKAFVEDQGQALGYTIAFEKDETTYDAYMKASGQQGIPTAFVIDKRGRIGWIGHPMDGMEEVVQEMVDGKFDIDVAKQVAAIQERLSDPANFGDDKARLADLNEWIKLKPSDPSPHKSKFRMYAYEKEDTTKALAAAEDAVRVGTKKPEFLAAFARELNDEDNRRAYGALAVRASAMAYAADPTNGDAIIARFEILVTSKKESEALAFAEGAVESIKGDPAALSRFAHALGSPDRATRCNSLAIRAVDMAIAAEPEKARHLYAKFMIQAVCQKDVSAANATGRYLIEKAGEDASLLNDLAWTLLTDEDIAGKFNALALAAAIRGDKLTESKDWMYVDTLALAKFENGKVDEAIRLQKKTIKLCTAPRALPELEGRLARFEKGRK